MGKTVIMVGGEVESQAAVERMLAPSGHSVHLFPSAPAYLAGHWTVPGDCVLLDLSAVGRDRIDMLRALAGRDLPLPVLATGDGRDVALAVEAMKLGAIDFLDRPGRAERLVLAIEEACVLGEQLRRRAEAERRAAARVGGLSARLRQVLRGMAQGRLNKAIAYELGLSTRTVESYRAQLLVRLGVRTSGEAIQIAVAAGLHAGADPDRRRGHA
ncbi:MAG: response regulator [Alphaproteobacteria bacterium]|nr:response regulator [Alphaproteobacteria bacterium]